jgi:hypothetical protein
VELANAFTCNETSYLVLLVIDIPTIEKRGVYERRNKADIVTDSTDLAGDGAEEIPQCWPRLSSEGCSIDDWISGIRSLAEEAFYCVSHVGDAGRSAWAGRSRSFALRFLGNLKGRAVRELSLPTRHLVGFVC